MRFGAHPTVVESGEVRSTVSIGIATATDTGYSLTAMLAGADRALYQAKAKGRNRIERAWPITTDLRAAKVSAAVS